VLAASYGSTDVVELLLAPGVDANAKDNHGKTAFDWATEKGNTEIADLLRAKMTK
jgi:ankyrin repeat protein